MAHTMRNLMLMFVAACSLSSCEMFLPMTFDITDEVSYTPADYRPQIVLQGLISTDYGVMAEVTNTILPAAKPVGPQSPEGAEVFLLQDGQPIASLHRRQAVADSSLLCQKFDFFLLPGEVALDPSATYALRASAPGFPTATSQSLPIPEPLVLDSAYVDERSYDVAAFYRSPSGDKPFVIFLQTYYERRLFADFLLSPSWLFRSLLAGPNSVSVTDQRWYYPMGGDSIVVQLVALPDVAEAYIQSLVVYENSRDEVYANYPEPVLSNVDGGLGFVTTLAASNSQSFPLREPWSWHYVQDMFDAEDYYSRWWFGD